MIHHLKPSSSPVVADAVPEDEFMVWLERAVVAIRRRPFFGPGPQLLDEDAVGEAVVSLLEQWRAGKLRPTSGRHLENQLRQTAAWRTLDGVRRRQRHAHLPLPAELLEQQTPPEPPWSEEEQEIVRSCVGCLARPQQRLVSMYYVREMTDKEIGIRLYHTEAKASASALGQRAYRQRQKMLGQLEQFLEQRGVGRDPTHRV